MFTGDEDDVEHAFYTRLGELRRVTGGWRWYDDFSGAVVFDPTQPSSPRQSWLKKDRKSAVDVPSRPPPRLAGERGGRLVPA